MYFYRLLALLVLQLVVAFPALAEGSGEGASSTLLWMTINFSIYAAILFWVYRKHGVKALKARSIGVEQEINNSLEQKRLAEEQLLLSKQRLEDIELEKKDVLRALEQEGEHLSLEVIKAAKRGAEAMERDVSRQVQDELAKAQEEIREEVVRGAMAKAHQEFSAGVAENVDQKLIHGALQVLEQSKAL